MTDHQFTDRQTLGSRTLGGFTAGQLLRLCHVAGLAPADAETYAQTLTEALGPVAERRLELPPPSDTFLSDDHTPVEFSLSFQPDAPPALRVLLDPGCGAEDLAQNGRVGLHAVRRMAERWAFSTSWLDKLEDLFLPPSPVGPLALWCALELRPGGVPKVKVYLNPAARGSDRAAETVQEAMQRLGYRDAFTTLPQAEGYPFFALDLGDWDEPRVKVYLRHHHLSAAEAGDLSRMNSGPEPAAIREFFRMASGPDATATHLGAGDGQGPRLGGRPGLSCHSFTDPATGRPSGFTLHVPVRDYALHDGEVLARAVALLRHHGMDDAPLSRALSAVTPRQPRDGVGLIAYLALANQQGRAPRVTAYISSEAYAVRPPAAFLPRQAVPFTGARESVTAITEMSA